MAAVVHTLNGAFNWIHDTWLLLLGPLGSTAQTIGAGVLVGALMAAVFRVVVRHDALREARRQLWVALAEIWLYRHEPGIVLRAEGRLLAGNVRYLAAFAPPLVLALVLVSPLLLQAYCCFGLEPLAPQQNAIFTAVLAENASATTLDELGLAWLSGAGRISAPLRQPAERRVLWRVRPQAAGTAQLRLDYGNGSYDFPVSAGGNQRVTTPARVQDPWEQLLVPRGEPLPAGSPFARMELDYPEAGVGWLMLYSAGSLAAALVIYRSGRRRYTTH